jgi:hypothetical protein
MNSRRCLSCFPNKIFGGYNLDVYKNYMFTKTTKDLFSEASKADVEYEKTEPEDIVVPDIEESNVVQPVNLVQPKQPDTLFWCLYIIHHGMGQYNNIGFNYGVKELEEKQRLATFIKDNSARIKGTNCKVTNILIQEILSELLTSQKETSMAALVAFTAFYNINIFMVDAHDRCALEFRSNKESEQDGSMYIIRKDKYGKYSVELDSISGVRIIELREQYIVLESYMRPIKAASNFKTEELVELAKRLKIYDENKKCKKVELYESIQGLCKWT